MPSAVNAWRRSLLHFGEPHSPYDQALRHFCSSLVTDAFTVARAPIAATESGLLKEIVAGRLFGALVTTGAAGALVPGFYVADLPYVFDSPEHAQRFWQTSASANLVALAAQAGLVVLAFYDAGTRHVFNRVRPAATPADLADLRMRTLPNRYHALWMMALGAHPVAMPTSSIRDAFAQGQIDGAERSYLNYRDLGLQDFAPFLTETAHYHLSACLVVSKAIWDAMTSGAREACMAAASSSSGVERAAYRASDDQARDSLRQSHLQILQPDVTPWRACAGAVLDTFRRESDGDRLLQAALKA
jgi:TRAP-type C4-dicarboxylate transport system substrate-binding protein